MSETTIKPEMTMAAILERIPSAQRALFQRYHVGGCSSCAFQPTDTLAQVCKDHNILDVDEVVRHLERSDELDRAMQVAPTTVQAWLEEGAEFCFLDVRPPEEIQLASLPQAEPIDFQDGQKYLSLAKETRFVFLCKSGVRSLDVAAYFAGHGFQNVHSVRGGLDAWRAEVDPSIPSY